MNFKTYTLLVLAAMITMAVAPATNAQEKGLNQGFGIIDTIRGNSGVQDFGSVTEFIITVLNVILSLAAIAAVVVMVYAGILLIADMGNEERAEKAKKIILYAIAGLVVIGVAAIVVNLIINKIMGVP